MKGILYIGYDRSTCDHPEMIAKIKKWCLIRLEICQTPKKAYSARFEAFWKESFRWIESLIFNGRWKVKLCCWFLGQPFLFPGLSMATCGRNSAGFPNRICSFLFRPCLYLHVVCDVPFKFKKNCWSVVKRIAMLKSHHFASICCTSCRLRVLHWPACQQISCLQHAAWPTRLAVGGQANPCVAWLKREAGRAKVKV